MKVKVLCFLAMTLFSTVAICQEICDNGVDDDGNGLIDLNDPECECDGILIDGDMTSMIPNPSFENFSCCPDQYSGLDCLSDWIPGNETTPDYYNTCDYVMPAIYDAGLFPFPDGAGVVSTPVNAGSMNMIGVCLNQPFLAGIEYSLSFHAAFVTTSSFNTCNAPPGSHQPINLTLYGTPTCNHLPVPDNDCPIFQGSSWVVLAEVLVDPVIAWQEFVFTFTPEDDIEAIMFGGPCVPPSGWDAFCTANFLWDNFSLFGSLHITELEISTSGDPCAPDFSLYATIDYNGDGQWQWYYEGIALFGQTDQAFALSENNYQSGTYQVTFSTPFGCVQDSISIELPSNEITEVESFFCPGESVDCAGQTFFVSGEYEVIFQSILGCDSIVLCQVEEYVLSPETLITIDTCAPFNIEVCGFPFSETGLYDILCTDWRGCDSLISLDLRVMDPIALIIQPLELSCDTTQTVALNGANSPLNPIPGGTTSYHWTGPNNGLQGDIDGPEALAYKPGKYCLSVTYEYNGITCRDSSCVTIISTQALPDLPLIDGNISGCYGDTLTFGIVNSGNVLVTGYDWLIPSGVQVQFINDSTILYPLNEPGSTEFCARTYNECGGSDTVCIQVGIGLPDTSILNANTCDPSQAGTDTLLLSNQHGCDSLVITTTSLQPSFFIPKTISTCDSVLAGSDTLFLQSIYGCDSIVVIVTIYTGKYEESTTQNICGQGTSYQDTLIITGGNCDSLFITQFNYYSPDTTLQNQGTCDPAQVGQQVTVLQDVNGCDSTIITTTTLIPSDVTHVDGFTCNAAEAIQDTLLLSNQAGCDSLVYIAIDYLGIDTQFVQTLTCDSALIGMFVEVIPGPFCDTVLVTNRTWAPYSTGHETIISCDPTGPIADTTFLVASSGCDSLHIRIFDYTQIDAEIVITDEDCAGHNNGSILVLQVQGGEAPYQYRLDSGMWQQDTEFNNLTPGNYTLTVQDLNGCTISYSGVIVDAGQQVLVDAGPDRQVEPGTFIDLSVQSTSLLSQIQWQANDPLGCSTCVTTSLGPISVSQTVTVQVITVDGCPGQDALDLTLLIKELEVTNIYIPNSFSPNNDGINDVFTIYGNAQINRIRNLSIFDRWGNALYSRSDLPINDPSQGWDGTFRDKIMDPGVYVYVFEIELVDGSTRLYKGDVTLVK